MNTGYYYAKNVSDDIDCFIFHDVDIIAEDDRIIYTCRGEYALVKPLIQS